MIFSSLILTYYTIDIYDILIIQETDGTLLTIKIEEYEPERTETSKHSNNDEVLH
jgi:hypothetical protein